MASMNDQGESGGGRSGSPDRRVPEWAGGLKQLYDSVVEEALPDSFKDLLDRLDAMDAARGRGGSGSGDGQSAEGGRDAGR
jgi:hypothetical protein